MRGATAGLIAAVLALAGCKSADKDADRPFGGFAGRPKGTPVKDKDKEKDAKAGPASWLEDGKSAGAGAAKGAAAADPNFNPKTAAQDALGGRVLDPLGRPARNVAIHMEPVGGPTADVHPADIDTNNEGYFYVRGLKVGHAYDVTAQAVQGGKPLTGAVQTKVPNPILTIVLRDDLPAPAAGAAPKGASDVFPPPPQPGNVVPPRPPAPKANDGAWSPPGGATNRVPAATIDGGAPKPPAPAPAAGPLPPPDDVTPSVAPVPERRENVAEAPKPFKPPVLNVPGGPPVPPLPALPPSFTKPGGGRSSMSSGFTTGSSAGKVALLDALERPWELASAPADSAVLVCFVESNCRHSRDALATLRDVQGQYGAKGLQVKAVLCDEVPQRERAARAAKYGTDHGLNFAVYVEPGEAGGVRDRFGVDEYPTAFLLTPGGKVLWTGHPGDRAKMEAAVKQSLAK